MDNRALQNRYRTAATYLSEHDPHLAPIVAKYGLPTFKPHTDYYQDLVESIIGQQLSVKAAATIKGRFKDLFGGKLPTPQEILSKDVEQLRSVGLSAQKANYVRDLAEHVIDGRVTFDKLADQTNDEIIADLTDVKGIGEWTVHMFLMFAMGRMDILAHGDLGIRNGIRKVYGLDHAPTPQEVKDIAQQYQWSPYQSIACWYLWAALDNKPIDD